MCKTYANTLQGTKNFSSAWEHTESTDLRLSESEDYTCGEPHKRALDLHLKSKRGHSVNEGTEAMKVSGIRNMQSADFAEKK